MALNSRLTSNKFSSIEKTANKYLVTYLIILVAASAAATVVRVVNFHDPVTGIPWYVKPLFFKDTNLSVSTARMVKLVNTTNSLF